jgi:hypothetical protein
MTFEYINILKCRAVVIYVYWQWIGWQNSPLARGTQVAEVQLDNFFQKLGEIVYLGLMRTGF